ncbi:IS110 family transposase [Salmonella enterica]|nr:IS110 family transposase [Salmonella enterica]
MKGDTGMYQLGIDVSKNTRDICLIREGIRGRLKTKRIKNDFRAVHIINAWLLQHDCALIDVHIIMEVTGVYHELLATGLHLAKSLWPTLIVPVNLRVAWIF